MNQPQVPLYNQGTILTVGSHQVKVLKYLTSGGFAQIYKVKIHPMDPFLNTNIVCLKRVIVPDKPSLNILRAEVDAMKLLRNNKNVVSYIDSHAAKFDVAHGSYEVFLLMEYCQNGGLIDFMNSRLQTRLQEPEVLSIMLQVSMGVAAMHSLQPPLLHRDIKIENVLIANKNEYKLCDFGSVCGIIRPPRNQMEFNYVQHDILKNTTAQYRSPEMVDLSRNLPIDEKSDIWALGVFLYKICYYTTPFEKEGENALLNARFDFPSFPVYSNSIKSLICRLLSVSPMQRPNIVQVVEEVACMMNIPCPIVNFYEINRTVLNTNNNNSHISMNYTSPNLIHTPHLDPLKPVSTVSVQNVRAKNQTPSFPIADSHLVPVNMEPLHRAHSTTDIFPKKISSKTNSIPKPIESNTNGMNNDFGSPSPRRKLPITMERMSLSPVSNPTSSTTPISSCSVEDGDENDIDDKIIESINKPIRDNMIGGRRSISIVKNGNLEDPFSSGRSSQSYHKFVQQEETDREKKELSKDDVKRKMLARLNKIGSKSNQSLPSAERSHINKSNFNDRSNPKTNVSMPKKKPIVPKKPEHLRPQKPHKPAFLVGKSINEVAGSTN